MHHHGHSCSHYHHHDHSHGHTHEVTSYGRAFKIGIALNIVFILAEAGFGFYANSLALLADAGHNVSDVLGLILAWAAMLAAKKKPSARYTYGLQSSSILAALANAILLLIAVGGIAWEGFRRIGSPEEVGGITVMAIAGLGIVVNGVTAMLFMKDSKDDLNIRGAYLHMMADAAVSAGVVVSGLVIMLSGWFWLDPVVSIVIAVLIAVGTWGLLRDSFNLALHAVPSFIDTQEVRDYLLGVAGVKEVHDLHIWAMSTNQVALSAHILMPEGHPGDARIMEISQELKERFRINHPTIQIELGDKGMHCPLASDEIV